IRDFHVTGVQTCALPISQSPDDATQTLISLVGRLGFEPRTNGLKARCSTVELTALGRTPARDGSGRVSRSVARDAARGRPETGESGRASRRATRSHASAA